MFLQVVSAGDNTMPKSVGCTEFKRRHISLKKKKKG